MAKSSNGEELLVKDPSWYKNAVIYEIHVRAFADSDGNGIGDFRGLTEKLDYLQELGVTALWLLPFYPSPLKDDGYDIAEYYSIHPDYGTLADFRIFLREAHRRGLRVITELVINHTSDQHPWFQRSRRAPRGSRWRDFYVWSETPDRFRDARIIFKDFESSNWSWDAVAGSYYWHRFYSHQPDLNYDHPPVHKEVFRVLDFWLDMGVDGLRLDAVPYLCEREGTGCENLPETHAFLKKLRAHVDSKYGYRMLLAEANQWPEDAVAYFGSGKGDECHMAFHFPLMPRLFMSVRMEDRVPIVDILEQTPPIPETSQWALFLRNHDELTLEMVTDEERDYMYRVYAQDPRARINLGIRRRLAPLLGNDRKRIELLNALLFSLPGTPVLYYGDEIGMGENIYLGDRNGVRTPMQWSSDRNAGFSRSNPQGLYLPVIVDPEYHYETVNVEAQRRNLHSLLWATRRLLSLRKQWKAFGQGTIEFLRPENRKILAFVRRHEEECVLVVANLSRFVQPVEVDLSEFQDQVPVELFGRTEFPVITDRPYFLTLSPHAFFWFSLVSRKRREEAVTRIAGGPIAMEVTGRWENVFEEKARGELCRILQSYVRGRRWFGGKAKDAKTIEARELIGVPMEEGKAYLIFLKVEYVQGDGELYVLPLTYAEGERMETLMREQPELVVARVTITDRQVEGVLYDAIGEKAFCRALFEAMVRRRTLRGGLGEVVGAHTPALRRIRGDAATPLEPSVGRAEQSNSAVIYGDRFIFKLFRRLEEGMNPDLEIGLFLTKRGFENVPSLAGTLEYVGRDNRRIALGILSELIANSKDAWQFTLDALGRYYERVQSQSPEAEAGAMPNGDHMGLAQSEVPSFVLDLVGTYGETARMLGLRTAELHIALASEKELKDFAPEPFTPHYQRSLFQSMRNLASENFQLLRRQLGKVPSAMVGQARAVLEAEGKVLNRFRALSERRITALRVRCHGDYHLGQVLHTGKDVFIIDFEGEPARSLSERRLKRSPLRDVAGMMRSFHYAVHAALEKQVELGALPKERVTEVEPWARFWYGWVSVIFLKAYFETASRAAFLPAGEEELRILLDAYLLEKAVYEMGYELNNRPDWLRIPLQGILHLIEPKESS